MGALASSPACTSHRSAARTSHRCSARSSTSLRCDPVRGNCCRLALAAIARRSESGRVPSRADLVELTRLETRRSHRDNPLRDEVAIFSAAPLYSQARAFLPTTRGKKPWCAYSVRSPRGGPTACLVHDAYRPWYVTKDLLGRDAKRISTTSSQILPNRPRAHNRGCAGGSHACTT